MSTLFICMHGTQCLILRRLVVEGVRHLGVRDTGAHNPDVGAGK